MKYIPILFQTEMVRSLISGTKTQTRRLPGPVNSLVDGRRVFPTEWNRYELNFQDPFIYIHKGASISGNPSPFLHSVPSLSFGGLHRIYSVFNPAFWEEDGGLCFWVRESFCVYPQAGNDGAAGLIYRADYLDLKTTWTPGIHMKKIHARIFLKVTSFKIERLHDISDEDAVSEGIRGEPFTKQYINYLDKDPIPVNSMSPRNSFFSLWRKINGDASFDLNPYVYAPQFERIDRPQDFLTTNDK